MIHMRYVTRRAKREPLRYTGSGIPHPVTQVLRTLDELHMQHLTADDLAGCLVLTAGEPDAVQEVVRLRGLMPETV